MALGCLRYRYNRDVVDHNKGRHVTGMIHTNAIEDL